MYRIQSKYFLLVFILTTLAFIIIKVQADTLYSINTVVGGAGGFVRETDLSKLMTPSYAVEYNNALYIVDQENNRIRKLDLSNNQGSTVAGSGATGYGMGSSTGNNGLATSATLNAPLAITFSSVGDMYITDQKSYLIRKVATNGIISTIAGTAGTATGTGDNGLATSATIGVPYGITYSSSQNSLYFSDRYNHLIRKIDLGTGIITRAAGSSSGFAGDSGLATSAKLDYPCHVALDSANNIYVADRNNNRIRKVSAADNKIYTVAGNGNDGICSAGACFCNANYTGSYCQIPLCNTIPANETSVCNGRGSCDHPNNCTCNDSNYGGTDCEKPKCFGILQGDSQVCSGHGQCNGVNQCFCSVGHGGEQCQYPICFNILSNETSVCNNGDGECTAPDTCVCSSNYTGSYCQYPKCFNIPSNDSTVCNSQGQCTAPNNCICNSNYSGANCDLPRCGTNYRGDSQVCNARGTCSSVDNCTCSDSSLWGGNLCQYPKCNSILSIYGSVCNGRGSCGYPNNCSCADSTSYGGSDCEKPKCYGIVQGESQVCSGNGQCSGVNQCNCSVGHGGEQCQFPICFNLLSNETTVCNNGNGVCSAPDTCQCSTPNNCICNSNYSGANCDLPRCGVFFKGDSQVCNARGVCESIDNCTCIDSSSWGGNLCQYPRCNSILSSLASVCNGRGSCISPNNCSCTDSNYGGTDCEKPKCYGILQGESQVCSGNGQCVGVNQCTCNNGYGGEQCQYPICFNLLSNETTVCNNGNGTCLSPDRCQCNNGWTGSSCDIAICYSILSNSSSVCSNLRGSCVSPNNCVCDSKYSGNQCELTTCHGIRSDETSSVCYGNGECLDYNICNCTDGYGPSINCQYAICDGYLANDTRVCNNSLGVCVKPNQCSIINFKCFGLAKNDSMVCSGNGNCTFIDECNCMAGWSGSNCSIPSCFGKLANESNVCYGHGKCISHDQCECNQGHFGKECSIPNCFGILSNNSNVCSSRGQCQDLNQCSCNLGYFGSDCSVSKCQNIYSNDTNVCSGHGSCIDSELCSCTSGWFGSNCSIPQCFGQLANESKVCSNHGLCTSKDQCICEYNWLGSSDCQRCTYGYFGLECKSRFIGPVMFSNDGMSLTLTVESPPNYINNQIDCSKLISQESLSQFGTILKCKSSNTHFTIEFGSDALVVPFNTIKLNRNILDNTNNSLDLESFIIQPASNPLSTVSIIDKKREEFSNCENITFSGENSYSQVTNRKISSYEWILIGGNAILGQYLMNEPHFQVNYENIPSGEYSVKLTCTDTLGGSSSDIFTFRKLKYTSPSIEIIGGNQFETQISNIPFMVKKKVVSESSCIPSDLKIEYKWSSNDISFTVDSQQDILIQKFPNSVSSVKGQLISTISSIKESFNKQDIKDITINLIQDPLLVDVFITKQNESLISISSEITDPIQSNTLVNYLWTCQDLTLQNDCSSLIYNKNLKEIDLNAKSNIERSLKLTLNATKGNRISQSNILLSLYPSSQPVPPIITIINTSPSIIDMGAFYSIQTEILPFDCKLDWLIDSKPIENMPSNLTSLMSNNLHSSNLILSTNSLIAGKTYTVTLIATLKESSLISTRMNFTFTINKPINNCKCTFTPLSGIAMVTDFTYYCTNCQTSTNLATYSFGFIDDSSSAKIPLYVNGEKFSSKLPNSVYGSTVTVFADVKDSKSGLSLAYNTFQISMSIPKVTSIVQVKSYVNSWNAIQKSISGFGLLKNVYNSAIITRVSNAMINSLSNSRRIYTNSRSNQDEISCSGRGQFNEEKQSCECQSGYFKNDCSFTQDQYSNCKEINAILTESLVESYSNRNSQEKLTWSEFILTTFGMSSLLDNYDILDEQSFEQILKTVTELNRLMELSSFKVAQEDLIHFQNIHTKLALHSLMRNQREKSLILFQSIDKFVDLMLRSRFVGMNNLILSNNVLQLTANQFWRNSLNSLNIDTVSLPSTTSESFTQKSRKTPIQIYKLDLPKMFYSINNETMYENSQGKETVSKKCLSNSIISVKLNSMVKLNSTLDPISINFTLIEPVSTISSTLIIRNETNHVNTNNDENIVEFEQTQLDCSIFNNGSWIVDKNTCLIELNQLSNGMTSSVTCKCSSFETISVIKTSRIIIQRTVIPVSPNSDNCSLCPLISLVAIIPISLLVVAIIGAIIWKVSSRKTPPETQV